MFRLKDLLATGCAIIFFVLRAKILDSLELRAEDGIASGQNIENAELEGKILRAKDFMKAAVEVRPVSGIAIRLPALGFRFVESGWELREERVYIVPVWPF